jgi:hypothetical protein
MSKAKAKVPDRNPDEIAKDVLGDNEAMKTILGKEDQADQVKEFGVQGKIKNNDQRHKGGTQMLLWAAVTNLLLRLASKPADSPDDPPKIRVDEEAPSKHEAGGGFFMNVFALLKNMVLKKDHVERDEFQTTVSDSGANADMAQTLQEIYHGINARNHEIATYKKEISKLQKDKADAAETAKAQAVKLAEAESDKQDALEERATQKHRADKAGVENAKLKEENAKLKKSKQRSKASPAGSAQDTVTTEADFQLSGCVLMVRTWLIKDMILSWATTKDTRAIMLDGVLTEVSPMRAVLSLLKGVVEDMIMNNLKSFLENHPAEKEEIKSTDPKLKASAYAKLLNMNQFSEIARVPLYAMIKAVYTAVAGVAVTAEQVSIICDKNLLGPSDMCVIPFPVTDKNGRDLYFPKSTEFQLIEAYLELSGVEAITKVAEYYLNDSWQMRSDDKFIVGLVAEKQKERDAKKERKKPKRAKTSNDTETTNVTTAEIELADNAVHAEVNATQTMLAALAGAEAEPGAEPGADSLIVLAEVSGQKRKSADE